MMVVVDQVVSVLAFSSDDLSSNTLEVVCFSVKLIRKIEKKLKETTRVGTLLKHA